MVITSYPSKPNASRHLYLTNSYIAKCFEVSPYCRQPVRRSVLCGREDKIGDYVGDDAVNIALTGKELGDFDTSTQEGKKALRAALKRHLNAMRGEVVDCPILGDSVHIEKRGIKETLAFTGDPLKMKALYAIKDLIKTAKAKHEQANHKPENKRAVIKYFKLGNTLTIDNKELSVSIIVEQWDDGKFHYDMIVDETKTPSSLMDGANVQQCALNYNSKADWVNNINAQSDDGVNNIFDSIRNVTKHFRSNKMLISL